MKRFIFSVLTIGLILGLSGCSSSPKDSLQSSVDEYKECTINWDAECIAKFSDPSLVKLSGGINKFSKNLEKDMKKAKDSMNISIKINDIGKISQNNNILKSNIIMTQTMEILDEKMQEVLGKKMEQKDSMIAISTDDGKNWYFTNKASQALTKELQGMQ